jgi:hypothetical protein
MKSFVLACTLGGLLISGTAYAQDGDATIDPSLIIRTHGSGLDADSYAQGNDHSGGMWEGATGYSSSAAQPAYVQTVPADPQWSRLNTRARRRHPASY